MDHVTGVGPRQPGVHRTKQPELIMEDLPTFSPLETGLPERDTAQEPEEADLGMGRMSAGSVPSTQTPPRANTTPRSSVGSRSRSPSPPPPPGPVVEEPDLSQQDEFTDACLEVEGRELYTCRGILASASPVWRRMFTAEFREREAGTVPLPGKRYEDVRELLLCISPASQKPVSNENVLSVLPLADEWQLSKLKTDCESWLLRELDATPTQGQLIRYLVLAQKFSLDRLLVRAVRLASALSLEDLEKNPETADLSKDTMTAVLRTRVASLEAANARSHHSATSWQRKTEELEDCLKKMSREKLTVKRALDDIEASWELKGSETRCIDPVHIYGPRNYGCEKCSRQVHTYIQSKVTHLLNRGSTCSGIAWPQ